MGPIGRDTRSTVKGKEVENVFEDELVAFGSEGA